MKANAPRPLVMVTFNEQVEYVNDAFLATLGWSRDAVISVAASSLLHYLDEMPPSPEGMTIRPKRRIQRPTLPMEIDCLCQQCTQEAI